MGEFDISMVIPFTRSYLYYRPLKLNPDICGCNVDTEGDTVAHWTSAPTALLCKFGRVAARALYYRMTLMRSTIACTLPT